MSELQESISYIRAWAARFDALEKKATPPRWTTRLEYDEETGYLRPGLALEGPEYTQKLGDEEIPGVRDNVCVLGYSYHKAHRTNRDLIATLRNAAPALVKALLALCDMSCGPLCCETSKTAEAVFGRCTRCRAIIATNRALRDMEESK